MRWAAIPAGILGALVLAGCTQQEMQGFLPGDGLETTNHTSRVIGLWTSSWIVLLGVGVVTWGLILWAAIVYRRRRGQSGLPAQLRYNMPVEIAFTVIPVILILGFFAFTARDQAAIEAPNAAEVKIEAYGKQWSWDFNYRVTDADTELTDPDFEVTEAVHEPAGIQAQFKADGQLDGENVPTLWLPVGAQVEIELDSRDVIHSFWVPDFLYKKDMIPGKTNVMYFVPEQVGEYYGKCAELCGEFHSQMLFKVKVVEPEEFQAHLAELAEAGYTGELGEDLDRNQNLSPVTEVEDHA